MVTVFDVDGRKLILEAATALEAQNALQPPAWSKFTKSGVCAERVPEQENWWFIRGAAMMRKIYMEGPIGVRDLRKEFGKKRRMGVRPARVYPASGAVTRKLMQQLEKAGYVSKAEKDKRYLGRIISAKGRGFLDSIAKKVNK